MNKRLATLPKKYSSPAVVDFETKITSSRVMTMKALLTEKDEEGDWKAWAWARIRKILTKKGLSGNTSQTAFARTQWDTSDFWESCLQAWARVGGVYREGETGLYEEKSGKWTPLHEITAKKIYSSLQMEKVSAEIENLEEKWKDFDLKESVWVIKNPLTSPEVKEFFTLLRHGNIYTKDRLFHIPYLRVENQLCEACGKERETKNHF